jgi:hypothetical protein
VTHEASMEPVSDLTIDFGQDRITKMGRPCSSYDATFRVDMGDSTEFSLTTSSARARQRDNACMAQLDAPQAV